MTQRASIQYCRISGMKSERSLLRATIRVRQAKHKAVAGLQARLKEVTNEILKMEMGHG